MKLRKVFVPNKPLAKLRNSVLHLAMIAVLFLPCFLLVKNVLHLKIYFLIFVFLVQLIMISFNNGRTLIHVFFKTYHEKKYKYWQYISWSVLYTLSVASLLFSVIFPFDLLILNLLVQLLTYQRTGTTLHQFLAGRMVTGYYK